MTLSLRIFLAWFLLVGLGTVLFLDSVVGQLPSSIRQASEEVLADSANLLAELVVPSWHQPNMQQSEFARSVSRYQQRTLNAEIWSRLKIQPDFVVYVTDLDGVVRYHTDGGYIGQDFSRWRDVALTLGGEYGARTTRLVPSDESSSYMFVAAPIRINGDLVGVLSVGQPTASLQPFLSLAHGQLWQRGSIILLVSLLSGAGLAIWLTRSIRRLVDYVERVGEGERVPLPSLGERELNRLALATEAMREEIDGKEYVEDYVHTLTHEMKSPLSAIRGAVGLLQEEDLPAAERERFVSNIDTESARLQRLIDRLLSLAMVEKRRHLQHPELLDMVLLVQQTIDSKQALLIRRNLRIQFVSDERVVIKGEVFLLEQAVSNLLDNAIDFAEPQSEIMVRLFSIGREVTLTITNQGEPIPEYALERIFERFYSLPRPDSGRKSTGLGLSFVSEVAELHGGHVQLSNIDDSAVQAELVMAINGVGLHH